MAKLKAPFMSFDARGQIGKAIVYSRWKGLPTARSYRRPSETPTIGRIREWTSWAAALVVWKLQAFTYSDRVAWYRLGARLEVGWTGFNTFMHYQRIDLMAGNLRPSLHYGRVVYTTNNILYIEVWAEPPGPAPILWFTSWWGEPETPFLMVLQPSGRYRGIITGLIKDKEYRYSFTRGTYPINYARLGIYSAWTGQPPWGPGTPPP